MEGRRRGRPARTAANGDSGRKRLPAGRTMWTSGWCTGGAGCSGSRGGERQREQGRRDVVEWLPAQGAGTILEGLGLDGDRFGG